MTDNNLSDYSISDLKSHIASHPNDPKGYYHLGKSYLELWKTLDNKTEAMYSNNKAREPLAEAVRLAPLNAEYPLMLAECDLYLDNIIITPKQAVKNLTASINHLRRLREHVTEKDRNKWNYLLGKCLEDRHDIYHLLIGNPSPLTKEFLVALTGDPGCVLDDPMPLDDQFIPDSHDKDIAITHIIVATDQSNNPEWHNTLAYILFHKLDMQNKPTETCPNGTCPPMEKWTPLDSISMKRLERSITIALNGLPEGRIGLNNLRLWKEKLFSPPPQRPTAELS